MPQPLSSLPNVLNIHIGNSTDSPSRHRPALALAAMTVVAEWSILESAMNGLFAHLLGSNPAPAAAIFSTIRSQSGQRDAMRAVIPTALPSDESRNIVFSMLDVYESASGLRNRAAHWVWGHSAQLPDAVLLGCPTALAAYRARLAEFSNQMLQGCEAAPPELDRRRIYSYTLRDFEESSTRIQRAMLLAVMVTQALMHFAHAQPEGEARLNQLSNEPEIRAAMDRLNKDRKNDP